ncbi:dihydropteroate synthase [Candidatus Amarobacter glycogenicus]|uniref:dihydropteroate synthase n=1 Tax=Candidatus Amarobacter glycogenicus TaxID=3140699 RepID=UPI002A14FAA7|nr:dihydropteroate synthase [Dehalococcoidia bacterium]
MIPSLRIAPPGAAHLAADPDAPHTAWFEGAREQLQVATSVVGLGIDLTGAQARVVASRSQLAMLAQALREAGSPHAAALRDYLEPVRSWKLRTRSLPLDGPLIMGILNLTVDSFSGDGVGRDIEAAIRRAGELRSSGADIIDIGAESARADRPALDEATEVDLAAGAVAKLVAEGHLVSIDTYKPAVARAALAAGAELVNDISGMTLTTGAAEAAGRSGAGYVLNYSYSVPKRRPDSPPFYEDVVVETVAWMERRLAVLAAAGLARQSIAIDPGIAFGKSHDEDIQSIRRIGELGTFGLPVLLAHSRKNFIGSVGGRPPAERDLETHVASAVAYAQGVRIFRVHDPAGARRALAMAAALITGEPGQFAPDGTSWPWRAGASAAHMTNAEPDKAAPAGQRW